MAKRENSFLENFLNVSYSGSEMQFNRIMLLEMIVSIITIGVGIFLASDNIINESLIKILLGSIVLLTSIINFISFKKYRNNRLFIFNIVFSILYLIVSILFITNLFNFSNYLCIYSGLYLLISGIKYGYYAYILNRVNEDSFLITCATAIITIILGGLLVFYTFESFGIFEVIGIIFILHSVLNISISNLLRNRICKFISKVDND